MIFRLLIVDAIFIVVSILLMKSTIDKAKRYNKDAYNIKYLSVQRSIKELIKDYEEGLISREVFLDGIKENLNI